MTQPEYSQPGHSQPAQDGQPQHWLEGILDILHEAVEGGAPGEGTAFLDGTAADGSGNNGLIATLDALSAAQASTEIHGTSIAGHARHSALHMEVVVRWERGGDRGPFDWKGSFHPADVDDEAWDDLRVRLRAAYDALCAFARTQKEGEATGDATGSMTGAVAHVAYHLGAIRQMVKGLA
ncbi:hypothetical protein [Deinococcus frigens]|uniref:hypothetical protein n=1 Tax=Deinococcus frigens TaxID=249403 RepID=UPI000690DC1E|nr:hypothetical protein [Deinococcus frigens]